MLQLSLGPGRQRLQVLCLGAHSDDIEIGCAGTLLRWLGEFDRLDVTWAIFCAERPRADETRISAQALLRGAASQQVIVGECRDAHLPAEFARAKGFAADLRDRVAPDVVLTHRIEDRHQDHRLVGELTWQTWRDALILEYEIPKYEGDLGNPNLYVPLTVDQHDRKIAHLLEHFGTQRSKSWFNAGTFDALMRLRGIECRSPSGFAEAFHMRKAVL